METKELNIDSVLAFFGLKMELGPIANWGLDLEAKSLKVNTKILKLMKKGYLLLAIYALIR